MLDAMSFDRSPRSTLRPLRRVAIAAFVFAVVQASISRADVRADDGPVAPPMGPTKRPTEKSGGFKFTPPDAPAGGPPAAPLNPKNPSSKALPPATDKISVAIRGLATWPGQDGVRAAETLLLEGPDAVEALLAALTTGPASVRPGAAWVLGKTGGPEHVPAIVRAAVDRSNGQRIETFFEAAWELDATLTKKWLFSFLSLERPVFRARATEFLAERITPEDRPRIDLLLAAGSKFSGVRIAGLELLARTKMPDAADKVIATLGDPYPEVAKRATVILATMNDDAVFARLNLLVREGDVRERSYATLALVEGCRLSRRNRIEPASVLGLAGRRGLLHPDRLPRAASAIGLAWGGLDSTEASIGGLLDSDVISVLIETAGGDHFLDYDAVVEPVFTALRRLSGLDLPATAKPWAQWWQENLGSFRARRTLSSVVDADLPRSRVVFDGVDADGRRRRSTFTPEGGDRIEGAYVLPTSAFRALLESLEDAGIFKGTDDQRQLADEHLAVRVGVMNQERRLVVAPSVDDPRHTLLRARLDALEEGNVWQHYRDVSEFPEEDAWWRKESQIFGSADAETRRSMLVTMIARSFDDLRTDADRAEALELLDRVGSPLSDADAVTLLSFATSSRAFGAVEARVVQKVAGLRRRALAEPLLEALARGTSPAAVKTLADILSDEGPLRVREAFADPRPTVRSAAGAAAMSLLASDVAKDPQARERIGSVLESGLRALLTDPDPLVRVKAAGSLGLMGDPTMIEKLQEIYRDGDGAVKIGVADALGRVGGAAVQPLLVRIVGEVGPDSAPIRAAALEAMALSGNKDFANTLAFFMLNDADASVRRAAEAALVSTRSDEGRKALIDLLELGTVDPAKRSLVVRALGAFDGVEVRETLGRSLEDKDLRVVDQAALGLARQSESVAMPYLIALLRRAEEPLRQSALEALQELTSTSFLVTGYEANADQYEAWFRTHRQGGDRAWFRDALGRRGYDTTGLALYVQGKSDLAAAPTLLRALRDEDPVVRKNADVALRRISGETFGVMNRTTAREEALTIADRWSAWWMRTGAKVK